MKSLDDVSLENIEELLAKKLGEFRVSPLSLEHASTSKDEGTSSNVPTYSSVILEDSKENFEFYTHKETKELIILLEQSDLKWKYRIASE